MNNIRIALNLIKIAGKLLSFEFPNQHDLDQYMKEHPDADPHSHWVKEPVHTIHHDEIKGPMHQHKKDQEPESPLLQQTEDQKIRKEHLTKKGFDPELDTGSPWVGKEEKFHEVLKGQPVELTPIGGEHVNQAYFEKHADGSGSVWKPENGSQYKVEDLRKTINPKISQSVREAVSYDLDQVLGLGVVPPTVYTEKKFVRDTDPNTEFTQAGSSQSFVDGTSAAEMDDDLISMYKDGTENLKLSMQKMALFDEITGNTDRHEGNVMVSNDKERVYGIDNGLTFPRKLGEKENSETRSVPMRIVSHFADDKKRPYDTRLIKQISKVKKDDFMNAVKKNGMDEEAEEAWGRLEKIKNKYAGIFEEEEKQNKARFRDNETVPPDKDSTLPPKDKDETLPPKKTVKR